MIEKNDFPWCVHPGPLAKADGWFDGHYSSKKKALRYVERLKEKFPDEKVTVFKTSRYYADGRGWDTKWQAELAESRRRERVAAIPGLARLP